MSNNRVKDELSNLINLGNAKHYVAVYNYGAQEFNEKNEKFLKELSKKHPNYKKDYHVWYSRAYRCVRSFAPERLEEFQEYYKGKKNIKELNYLSAGITHYLQGMVTTRVGTETQDYFAKFTSGIQEQINILESIKENLESILFNLESEIHYGIFKSEIDVAQELLKHKQIRAAGAVAGVVIEGHLKLVCANNGIKFRKQNPTISDYNEALKKEKITDLVMWRLITRCGDIRNLCTHAKDRDPTVDEVEDITRAAEKIIAEVS